jgi:hypothetical protein
MSVLTHRIPRWSLFIIPLLIVSGAYVFYKQHPYVENIVYDYPLVQDATKALEQATGSGTGSAVTAEEFIEESDPPETPFAPDPERYRDTSFCSRGTP